MWHLPSHSAPITGHTRLGCLGDGLPDILCPRPGSGGRAGASTGPPAYGPGTLEYGPRHRPQASKQQPARPLEGRQPYGPPTCPQDRRGGRGHLRSAAAVCGPRCPRVDVQSPDGHCPGDVHPGTSPHSTPTPGTPGTCPIAPAPGNSIALSSLSNSPRTHRSRMWQVRWCPFWLLSQGGAGPAPPRPAPVRMVPAPRPDGGLPRGGGSGVFPRHQVQPTFHRLLWSGRGGRGRLKTAQNDQKRCQTFLLSMHTHCTHPSNTSLRADISHLITVRMHAGWYFVCGLVFRGCYRSIPPL